MEAALVDSRLTRMSFKTAPEAILFSYFYRTISEDLEVVRIDVVANSVIHANQRPA